MKYLNIQRHRPPPEAHQDFPSSSPVVKENLSEDEIEAKERLEPVHILAECAVKEFYERRKLIDLNLPPPPETHEDSSPLPAVVMNSDKISKEKTERFEILLDVVEWAMRGVRRSKLPIKINKKIDQLSLANFFYDLDICPYKQSTLYNEKINIY